MTPLKLSWSAIQSFLKCQRKYELSYVHNLAKVAGADKYNLTLGSAFHAGVEAAVRYVWEIRHDPAFDELIASDAQVLVANRAARAYLVDHTIPDKMAYIDGLQMPDDDYYAMLRDVGAVVVELLRYHIPLIGLGTAYLPTSEADLLRNAPPGTYSLETDDPVVEWNFEYEVNPDTTLVGFVDSVLWDRENSMYVLVDWKTRGGFPFDELAALDGQLHLYAAVINAMAYSVEPPINNVVMWQFLTKAPAKVKLLKSGLPSAEIKSLNTTWEVWSASLPKGLNPKHFEETFRPKMKTDADFQRLIWGVVNKLSSEMALVNVEVAADAIRAALASGRQLPAILSSDACKYCDFIQLCGTVLRYGGNAELILKEKYTTRHGEIVPEDTL